MSEIKRISPMLDGFDVGGPIGDHCGVRCYPAMRAHTDDKYIVKTISIPASQTQLDALLLTGAFSDATAALAYFKESADRIVEEVEILNKLSQFEGFLPVESCQVSAMSDGIGFEVFTLCPYRRTLRKHFQRKPMTHLGAVNLGLDICAALAVCRRAGYLYVDLKPNNIYVLDESQYRISDLGFIPLSTLSYASLPERYLSEYTAPEIQDAFSTLNTTLDTYALGLILHQIYNGGELPVADAADGNRYPAPLNADYELAEIILKALDPDPAARWQDPVEMGQALVSYMQRNGVNDTPIVPPVIPEFVPQVEITDDDLDLTGIDLSDIPDIEDEIITDPETSADEIPADAEVVEEEAEEPAEEVTVAPIVMEGGTEEAASENTDALIENLPDVDETMPEHNIQEVAYEEVSDELTQILEQVDELTAHPVPDPVVAPEPIEVQLPVVETPAEEPAAEETDTASSVSEENEDASMDQTVVVMTQANHDEETQDAVQQDEPEPIIEGENDSDDTDEIAAGTKKTSWLTWLLNGVLILLILAILAVGFFYYRNIYLLPIDNLQVTGDESSMVIHLDSSIDESLLSVVCSDSHGNQISAPVVDGTATFANLAPDTAYNVRIIVEGFHRLTGETAVSYSTPAQTNVVQFSAVTGTEDGSVVLGFTVEGPDNGTWSVEYSADGEPTQTVELLSHLATLSGLTIGKEYTFTLIPGEDMYLTGITQIKFTASEIVYAENVSIVSCVDNQMTVEWTAPEDSEVSEWTVRCYNDAEYNETIITANTAAIFNDIDPNHDYTVDITAAGMSVSQRAYMAANAITVSDFTVEASATELSLSWSASESVPEGGWVLLYTTDNSGVQSSMVCTENSAVISPVVPNCNYYFTLQQTNGSAVLTKPLTYKTAKAQDFSGYGMIRSSMTYKLCKTPADADWKYSDLSDSDYTNEFKVGENISVVGQLHDTYGISKDSITMLYVFRDVDGNVVCYSNETTTWNEMWSKSYGEFNIPQAPSAAGEYELSIYFNGKLVTVKDVTITE